MLDALAQTAIEHLLPLALAAGGALLLLVLRLGLKAARKEAEKTPTKADDKALDVAQEVLDAAFPNPATTAKE